MSSYSEGQTHQLMNALEKSDFKFDDLTKLGQSSELFKVRDWVRGLSEITEAKHFINCNIDPRPRLRIEKHQTMEDFVWNPDRIKLFQVGGETKKVFSVSDVFSELKNKKTLNANVLDYLLDNKNLIPDGWKDKFVIFMGTTFVGPGKSWEKKLCVGGISFNIKSGFCWRYLKFGDNFPNYCRIAFLD